MNDMRKLIQLTENTYSDEAEKHIDGLAKVIAGYLRSVSDDPYVFSDIIEFMGGRLDQRVSELLKNKITEAIRRPELNVIHTEKELEAAYQQLISICDAYEVTIEMQKEREYKTFIYGVEWGNSAQYNDGGYQAYELPAAYKEWVEGGRKGYYDD